MLKVFCVVLVTMLTLSGCGIQENKATVTTFITPKYQVDINMASKIELEDSLHGVGSVTASKIIASREVKPFDSIYDLRERNIIGKDLFSNIKGDIKVGTTINKYSGRITDAK
ncbi:MAG: helix-hairpin-helix domain-containing protein [Cellulosilyticaceae bacterium]